LDPTHCLEAVEAGEVVGLGDVDAAVGSVHQKSGELWLFLAQVVAARQLGKHQKYLTKSQSTFYDYISNSRLKL